MSKLDALIAEMCPNGIEYRPLESILKIRNGSDYKGFGPGDIPVYGSGGIMTYIDHFAYDKPSVLIPRKGSVDKLYYVDTPFWNVDTVFLYRDQHYHSHSKIRIPLSSKRTFGTVQYCWRRSKSHTGSSQ